MPKFSLIVTRDTTESCHVEIDAPTEQEAQEKARLAVRNDPSQFEWEADDTPNASRHVYVTNCEIAGLEECTTCSGKFEMDDLDAAGECAKCRAYDDQGNLKAG